MALCGFLSWSDNSCAYCGLLWRIDHYISVDNHLFLFYFFLRSAGRIFYSLSTSTILTRRYSPRILLTRFSLSILFSIYNAIRSRWLIPTASASPLPRPSV